MMNNDPLRQHLGESNFSVNQYSEQRCQSADCRCLVCHGTVLLLSIMSSPKLCISTSPSDFKSRGGRGVCQKNAYELLNLRALKIATLYKNYIFHCMDKIFCVEFQRVPYIAAITLKKLLYLENTIYIPLLINAAVSYLIITVWSFSSSEWYEQKNRCHTVIL